MKIDLKKIEELVDNRYVLKRKHPTEDLWIYNYTQKTVYENYWNEETLICRGLILNKDGKIIARPFKKFFSIDQHNSPNVPGINLNQKFKVFNKYDGSLGILYFDKDGYPNIATRGSFDSRQAIKGTELLHKILQKKRILLNPQYTYLFEIIYSENKIIIDYGKDEMLILLGIFETSTGKEIKNLNVGFSFESYTEHEFSNQLYSLLDKAKNSKWNNKEGYVIKFEDGNRLKIKNASYTELARFINSLSTVNIWKAMSNGNDHIEELTKGLPIDDKIKNWVQDKIDFFNKKYGRVETLVNIFFNERVENSYNSRKELAETFLKFPYSSILFAIYDGKSYSNLIWKKIKPKKNEFFSLTN